MPELLKDCEHNTKETDQIQQFVSTYLSQIDDDKEMIRKNILLIPNYVLTTGIFRAKTDFVSNNYFGLGKNIGSLVELMFKEANNLPMQEVTEVIMIDFPLANELTPEIVTQIQEIEKQMFPEPVPVQIENLL